MTLAGWDITLVRCLTRLSPHEAPHGTFHKQVIEDAPPQLQGFLLLAAFVAAEVCVQSVSIGDEDVAAALAGAWCHAVLGYAGDLACHLIQVPCFFRLFLASLQAHSALYRSEVSATAVHCGLGHPGLLSL